MNKISIAHCDSSHSLIHLLKNTIYHPRVFSSFFFWNLKISSRPFFINRNFSYRYKVLVENSCSEAKLDRFEKMNSKSFTIEYAKSARSTCKTCDKKIEKGNIRLGNNSKTSAGYLLTHWHHFQCFLNSNSPALGFLNLEKISGFSILNLADKEELKNQIQKFSSQTISELVDDKKDGNGNSNNGDGNNNDNGDDNDIDNDANVSSTPSKRSNNEMKHENENRNAKLIRKKQSVRFETGNEKNEFDLKLWEEKISFFNFECLSSSYKGSSLPCNWKSFESVIFNTESNLKPSTKIAAFDFDGCLANTNVRIMGAHAWKLMYNSIPKILKQYHDDGFKLVIFTNESNIDRFTNARQKAVDSKIGRIQNFFKVINLPIQTFISCSKNDFFRKPSPGMWMLLENSVNESFKIDKSLSFFVGDAAGRPQDHSDSDLKFAQGLGLPFFVPEDIFL